MTVEACREFRECLPEYLTGATGAATASRLRDHLAACPDCRRELESLVPVAQGLDHLAQALPDPPPWLAARALARARAEAQEVRPVAAEWRWLFRPPALAGLTAALALALLLAGRPTPPKVVPPPALPPGQRAAEPPMVAREAAPTPAPASVPAPPELAPPETAAAKALSQPQASQSQVRLMSAADQSAEAAWVEVFAGSDAEARKAVSRLSTQGITARLESTGSAQTRVTVAPADSGRAARLLHPEPDVQVPARDVQD